MKRYSKGRVFKSINFRESKNRKENRVLIQRKIISNKFNRVRVYKTNTETPNYK